MIIYIRKYPKGWQEIPKKKCLKMMKDFYGDIHSDARTLRNLARGGMVWTDEHYFIGIISG